MKNGLSSTIVFVDYESWFWGLYNKYGKTPDLKKLVFDVKQRANLEQIYIFGDFTKDEIQKERTKLRTITNNIIDCSNPETKKDYTDFIMLDHIYKTILQRNDIEQYILVTGDGHFHSVVAYLTTFLDKDVGIYAVKGSFSNQLKECATWSVEIEPETDERDQYHAKILQNIHWAERKGLIPTFERTIDSCSKYNHEDKLKLAPSLSKLIEDGYIIQEMKKLPNGFEVRALVPKWDLIEKHGIWNH